MSVSDVLSQALRLTAGERAELAQRLLTSLEAAADGGGHDVEWAEEIERRALAYERGEISAEDWRDVMKELRSSLHEGRKP